MDEDLLCVIHFSFQELILHRQMWEAYVCYMRVRKGMKREEGRGKEREAKEKSLLAFQFCVFVKPAGIFLQIGTMEPLLITSGFFVFYPLFLFLCLSFFCISLLLARLSVYRYWKQRDHINTQTIHNFYFISFYQLKNMPSSFSSWYNSV